MSTTEKGNSFRDSVKALFELNPRYINVNAEHRVGHQDVDIYYEELTSTRTLRVACECKDYSQPLTRSDLESIYAKYQPLYAGSPRRVDEVRIIARKPLGSNAQQYIRECGYTYTTLDELEQSTIDFSAYLQTLGALYEEDGLSALYIRATLKDESDAENTVLQWLDGPSDLPIALLAGYGMGKTSFARHMAATLASAYRTDARRRIPILIPLAEISSEQSLEGLLGRLFSSQYRVPGYHFGLFTELNARGRFLVLLDGFDEMKHAMSWREFKFNFAQLNRLVVPKSRVILLGRPSALLSENEEMFVLRGIDRRQSQDLEVPGAPEYRILELREFTTQEALEFINGYVKFRARRVIRDALTSDVEIRERITTVSRDTELSSLARRPVQARMIANLVTDSQVRWRSFSRYELYDVFITRLIERELDKVARLGIGFQTRIKFHETIASWLWQRSGAIAFNLAELPKNLLAPFVGSDCEDPDGQIRELIAGSVLERKLSDSYYFPHRSFVEFLVARRICTTDWRPQELGWVSDVLDKEIVDFVHDAGVGPAVAKWSSIVNEIDGRVSLPFLDLIAWGLYSQGRKPNLRAWNGRSARDVLVGYLYLIHHHKSKKISDKDVLQWLWRGFSSAAENEVRIGYLLAMVLLTKQVGVVFESTVWEVVAACVLSRTRDIGSEQFRRVPSPAGVGTGDDIRFVPHNLVSAWEARLGRMFPTSLPPMSNVPIEVTGEAADRWIQKIHENPEGSRGS